MRLADTSARTLRLLGLLQHHRFWPGDELADRLEVSARTLRRDIERLRTLGYPVKSAPGTAGGYQLEPGASMPPLLLDDDEATALVVGLQTAAHGPVAGIADASLRALGKVMQILPTKLQRQVDAVHAMTVASPPMARPTAVSAPILAIIAQACRDEVRVRFGYTARDGQTTERSVEPYRIVTLGQRFYLVAFDMDRSDWRTFRLDRIAEPDPARNRFDPRPLPAENIAEYVRTQIEQLTTTYEIEVEIHVDAETAASKVGRWAHFEATGEGTCVMTMRTDALDWAAFTLATLDVPFTMQQPDELRELLQRWVAGISASLEDSTF